MSQIEQRLPERRTLSQDSLTIGVPSRICPDPVAVDFCARLSSLLLNDARARLYPDLQALGFWLRPAQVNTMLREYLTPQVQTVVVPAGTVLALPPGNVDALFGYIVALALLCGNAIVARLSSAVSPAQELLVTMLGEALHDPAVRARVTLLHYGHDDAVTAQLSAQCDLRLVWGGDATVQHIRQIPLSPLAREISFGDRFSAAAIDAAAYLAVDGVRRTELTRRFYNDVYWYDQMACAAPRLLFWVGEAAACAEAATEFYQRLAATAVQMGYRPDAGASVAKQTMAYLGLHDLQPQDYQTYGAALSVLTIADFTPMPAFKQVNYGYGILVATAVPNLDAIAGYAERRDQTLTYWGFTPSAMAKLAQACGGRGFDRMVPVGQALHFDPVWDGCNLFAALTRTVRVI
jgi:hypothetical protein